MGVTFVGAEASGVGLRGGIGWSRPVEKAVVGWQ
jgi:hypothetical protein